MPKYSSDETATLSSSLYTEIFTKKGVKFLRIKRTTTFSKLQGLEMEIKGEHVWSTGNSLAKLSYRFYGTMEYWWVIGLINKKPTDAHYSNGDIVYIPSNPSSLKERMR